MKKFKQYLYEIFSSSDETVTRSQSFVAKNRIKKNKQKRKPLKVDEGFTDWLVNTAPVKAFKNEVDDELRYFGLKKQEEEQKAADDKEIQDRTNKLNEPLKMDDGSTTKQFVDNMFKSVDKTLNSANNTLKDTQQSSNTNKPNQTTSQPQQTQQPQPQQQQQPQPQQPQPQQQSQQQPKPQQQAPVNQPQPQSQPQQQSQQTQQQPQQPQQQPRPQPQQPQQQPQQQPRSQPTQNPTQQRSVQQQSVSQYRPIGNNMQGQNIPSQEMQMGSQNFGSFPGHLLNNQSYDQEKQGMEQTIRNVLNMGQRSRPNANQQQFRNPTTRF